MQTAVRWGMRIELALIESAHAAHTATALREDALALLTSDFAADVGMFLSLESPIPIVRGLHAAPMAALGTHWEQIRAEVRPVKAEALRVGATTDRRVLGASLPHTVLYRHLMAPIGGIETLFLVPHHAGRALGMIILGRCGAPFSMAAVAAARRLIPVLSVGCRAAFSPVHRLPALSAAESNLLDFLELGLSTAQIATARGTSFFTVRNQLSALYRKLDVANRAEAIGRVRARPHGSTDPSQ